MVDSHFSSPNQAGIGSRSELNDQAENHNAPTTMAALARAGRMLAPRLAVHGQNSW
jgi:hypothetical protein